ncbi:MAG: DUF1579 family protein [Pyrinomonadaceae bacterium]
MAISSALSALVGKWSGTNRLHMVWDTENPIRESQGTASVAERVGGQVLEISYTWVFEDEVKEGLLLISGNPKSEAVEAFWTDSWHLTDQMMLCSGTAGTDGSISVSGTYKVEGHPEWGWRTEIIPGDGRFRYNMYNVSPEGVEDIAVEMEMMRT